MGESLRRFGVSSLLSYRALFTWLNPWGYASSRVVAPILIVVLFGLVAEQSGQPVLDTILGGTLLAIANSVIFGVAIAIGNERAFGTLSAWLSAPQGVGANLAGKAAVHLADGLLGAGLSLAVAALVFGTDLSGGQLLQLLLVALTVLVSASGAALLIAATSLGFRDTFTAPNVLVLLLMVLSGALVPVEALPLDVDWLSSLLPVHHAATAAVSLREHGALPAEQLALELAVGVAWGTVAYTAVRLLMRRARRTGSFDLI